MFSSRRLVPFSSDLSYPPNGSVFFFFLIALDDFEPQILFVFFGPSIPNHSSLHFPDFWLRHLAMVDSLSVFFDRKGPSVLRSIDVCKFHKREWTFAPVCGGGCNPQVYFDLHFSLVLIQKGRSYLDIYGRLFSFSSGACISNFPGVCPLVGFGIP